MSGNIISPWQPDTNKLNLAVLGKLLEELGETTQIASRCIIQGIHEKEPVTGKPNIESLENELADLDACIDIIIKHFDLDVVRMMQRQSKKEEGFNYWHTMIEV